MKHLIYFIAILIFSKNYAQETQQKPAKKVTNQQKFKTKKVKNNTIYQFKVTDLNGDLFDFASLKGKKIMIVNTASKCGLTPQYKDLEAIFEKYKSKNFIIIGFPANNFASQEPGSNQEIAAFCSQNYGVSFPMMAKISVKGNDMAAIYQFLTQKVQNQYQDSEVEWNFQKYLINQNGQLEKVIAPQVLPTDSEIIKWILN